MTDIDVPSSAEIMFHDKEEDYFFPVPGRRSQYTVFRFEEYPTDFLSDNNFQDETNDSFEDKFDRELESHMSAEHFNVPDEYYAHWDNEYLWLDTSTGIYFVYFIENHLLIVFVTAT
ncbi:hypothetical protein IY230_05680 [Acholeplasma laidlawii]|uniref:hypothetical protein n=1 Tax=Acholeplasma laidlawii TaxID=2148 RepID=UPI0018C32A26|nr:hypothetical protein [Acholeplasma laidlawii]MBG0763091.1 hypothetical protein [Acholeplasma laidlawii]